MAPKSPIVPGLFTFGLESAGLNEDISLDELCPCIRRFQRGKSPGIDGIVANMIKDGGDLVMDSCCGWSTACLSATSLNICLLALSLQSTSLLTSLM